MSPDPFKDLDPAQNVKVLPRHLAGPGVVDLHTAWPFPSSEGWSLHQPEEGTAYATSPCLRLWTRFVPEPEKRGKGTWTIGANRAPFGQTAWQITFDATTPIELLHDVHAELLDLYVEDLHGGKDRLFEDKTAPHEVYAPLFLRGWSHEVKTDGTQTFLTPEGHGGVRHWYALGEPSWLAWGGIPGETHWQAHFSISTPTTLVQVGLGLLPSKSWQLNAAWVLAAALAADLDAWTRLLLLPDEPEFAAAQPQTIRTKLYHLPARLTSHARRRTLHLDRTWPWAAAFTTAWQRATQLPALT